MSQSEEVVRALEALKAERKFDAEALYPGAPNEAVRLRCEGRVNDWLAALIQGAPQSLAPERVLAHLRALLTPFDDEDTEERERVGAYGDRILDILGIASSEGILNTWLYGFDPTEGD
jgi:hypothetical protein